MMSQQHLGKYSFDNWKGDWENRSEIFNNKYSSMSQNKSLEKGNLNSLHEINYLSSARFSILTSCDSEWRNRSETQE